MNVFLISRLPPQKKKIMRIRNLNCLKGTHNPLYMLQPRISINSSDDANIWQIVGFHIFKINRYILKVHFPLGMDLQIIHKKN